MYFKMNQPAKPQVQRSQCSIQHGRNHTANNIYKCWTSCNKCKYLFLQYSVSNQKHNSCKIYLKILQVVSKGRKIYWLAGGVIGYDSERGPHKDHSTKVWSHAIGQVSFRGEDFKWFFLGRIFYFQQWRPSCLGAGSPDTILKGDHPSTTNLAKFSPNWPSGFRGEY